MTDPVIDPSSTHSQTRAGIAAEPERGAVTVGARHLHAGAGQAAARFGDVLDEGALFRLLDLAGPEIARELLDRLISDLCQVKQGLAPAGQPTDWQAVQRHSHVLISLAGAVGATRLQAQAEKLNLIAHQSDRTDLGTLMPDILNSLVALIEAIEAISRDDRALPA